MKTRLLGAAVLIALAVLFVPMFFSSTPPSAGGDQSVNLAIPPAPDRDLQTRTMSLNPQESTSSAAAGTVGTEVVTPGSGDKLATVDIASQRPRDVETDADAGKPPAKTTVTTGSGTSPEQPVIPMQGKSSDSTAVKPTQADTAAETSPAAAKPAAPTPPPAGHGSYTLNLSAYASASSVSNLQHRVQALGYPVSTHPLTVNGKSLTAVTAGPFETRAAAEAARLKITQSVPGVPAQVEQDAGHERSSSKTPSTATANTSKAGGWAVQVAAVSSKTDAIALRDKLRANGFDGFVDSVQSGGKQLWRVRAGPQTQRTDAQRLHDEIKAKLGIDGNVVSVP